MFSYQFFYTSVLNVQSMTIHSYVEGILCFPYILDCTFITLDHIDHVGRLAVSRSFDTMYLPSNWTFKFNHSFYMLAHFTACLMALGISCMWWSWTFEFRPHKGSTTVVMSIQDYPDKLMSHLQNEKYYLNLDEELTSCYAEEITRLLREMMDRPVIDKETFKYLQPQDPCTSWFYILPKIYKEAIREDQ